MSELNSELIIRRLPGREALPRSALPAADCNYRIDRKPTISATRQHVGRKPFDGLLVGDLLYR
jgi:hypothetical protein